METLKEKRDLAEITEISIDSLRQVMQAPIRLVPMNVRPITIQVWMMYANLQGFSREKVDPSLCTWINHWINHEKIPENVVIKALESLRTLDAVSKLNFASQLIQLLSQKICDMMRDIKRNNEMLERRKEAAKQQTRPTLRFAEIGKMPS
jgi:hypothetical protein